MLKLILRLTTINIGLPFFASVLLLLPLVSQAQSAGKRTLRLDGTIGFQNWSDAGDLRTQSGGAFGTGGSFDSGGFILEFNIHTAGSAYKSSNFLWGGTLGVFGHDSNIRGFFRYQDLQLSGIYLTPSVKWVLQDTRDRGVYLDLGAGYYSVSINEYDDYCYWTCSSWEYYDDDGFGGFVGLSADFDVGRPGGAHLTTGIKAHFVDFDTPFEIGSQSELGGTIVQFQIGVATR